jgi:homoserine O-acetyltransferase
MLKIRFLTGSSKLLQKVISNPQMEFSCIDKLEERQSKLEQGPEPNYELIVKGFSISHHNTPFNLVHGGVLPEFNIAYETWGKLNDTKDNAILLHTGLSASSHAKSHDKNPNPGWWEKFIGPGLALDTNKFHIICTNVLGGCFGSTGPSSVDPSSSSGERYATGLPILTIFDMVRAQFKMLDRMGINKLHASVGSSMGGMQSLAAAALFPERVGRLVTISAAARSHPYSIALRFVQRQILMSDPNWNKGYYYNKVLPHTGMKVFRKGA